MQTLYGIAERYGQCGVLIHDSYPDVWLCHALLHSDFSSRWLKLLEWPLVSLFGVPDLVEESVTELTPLRNFLLHLYTCCSDRHASRSEFPSVSEFRWVSPLHFVKNEWQNAVPLWCMLQVGPPSLYYCCAIVLRFSVVLPPVGHTSNHEYHCCQLTGQSSDVLNFYHTFKVSIWLTFVKSLGYCRLFWVHKFLRGFVVLLYWYFKIRYIKN